MNPVDYLCRLQALSSKISARRRRLHRLALTWCRDQSLADDLVQETFLKALRRLNQLRDVTSIDAWLSNILFNCWRDLVRSRHPTLDIDQFSDLDEMAVACEDEKGELAGRVHKAIATLPLAQREVLALVDLHGYSYAEVAVLLDIPNGTVTSRISRAREALREQLMDFVAVTPQVIQMRKTQ